MLGLEKGQFGYTRREERLNFLTHLAALLASASACAVMLWRAAGTSDPATIAGTALFSFTLVCVFAASSVYHGLPDGPLKQAAKKWDHISIYLIICGLYTALVLAAAQNAVGAIICACVWSLGIWGAAKKFKNCPTGEKPNELPLYIAMSALIFPIFHFLDFRTILLLLSAAVLNVAGLFFYKKKGIEFTHFVWHLFSFAASSCDYFAVLAAFRLD